jgi:hypothetical protein
MGFMKPKVKKVVATAQEKAVEQRQARLLDEEIAEGEKRLKAVARGKLGAASLLGKTKKAKPSAAKTSKPTTMKPTYNLRGIGR